MAYAPRPEHRAYDVVIVGGGMIGAAIAWWTARDPAFDGRILVIERDPSYEYASTTHTNSCIRQQFGTEVNVRISRFGAEFIHGFRDWMEDAEAPAIALRSFGYLYLAGTDAGAARLREAQALQARLGCATRLLTPDEIAARWPHISPEGVLLGTHNPVDEGWFDGATMFDWFRRRARALGVEFVHGEATGALVEGGRVMAVRLGTGQEIACGFLVNAAGPRAAALAAMAGLSLPVEPRRRFTWVFDAPLAAELPLTIDPAGVHVRSDGAGFMAGCPPDPDETDGPDDFRDPGDRFETHVWPILAARVPAFENIRLRRSWVGHYAYNLLDQNAVLGPHPDLPNFLFANGFSGHGLQQAPAVGRGLAELLLHGRYTSLDLSDLGYARIAEGRPLREPAII
ncbi:NAD(P)/FAD-dependent oxidoreductase [Wenxinia marina]|uniref:Glycine/D-amino acid oxidase (Deaminating) n=1 Tax=Wenxinia marina DSM 24838 TaxID=1123501 RepID=A0A0D0QBP1_9RHOB|nr:FAD-binding oxidoreductase [Wenxinia marina]KIQ68373.1 Glycine/D-amino acid oxidase (deaminating) [Wenxinia marina DSM 24838]GGL72713.1 oxidoreductase [Wenxinia marina]